TGSSASIAITASDGRLPGKAHCLIGHYEPHAESPLRVANLEPGTPCLNENQRQFTVSAFDYFHQPPIPSKDVSNFEHIEAIDNFWP
ncbi:hypothetical protein NGM37_54685, partial [Streptomyces sp. TRM76130]|nr:hypothetical protein [Streptomyces sp. TRM76130]